VPLSQAIMVDTYPAHERGKALAIWGMGVMVAPILGPTVGGWLTETVNWRWNFYINVPIGALSLLLAFRYVPDTPVKARDMDWWGLAFLALFIGGLQYTLDRGQQEDWLDSGAIRIALGVMAGGLGAFVWHAVTTARHPLFSLRLFTDRNFTAASIVAAAMGLSLYGGMLLQPLLFENVLQYPTFDTGVAMVPRGIGSLFSMLIVGRMLPRFGAKKLIYFGIAVSLIGCFGMTRISLDASARTTLVPLLLQGFGIGFIFIPLSAVAFATLPRGLATEAAGVYNLIRSIGSSIGISIVSVYTTRAAQSSWAAMRGYIDPYRAPVQQYLDPLHLKAQAQGLAIIAQQVALQAQMLGLLQAFWLITASFLVMIPLVMLLRPVKGGAAHAGAVAE
jgi:DHA2 family multidrug resistance protein